VPALVGAAAPDFSTRNQFGQTVTLSRLRGQPVLVVFFPWAFSGICTGELTTLQQNLGGFEGAGARVLAISCDPMFALRAFAEQEQFGFDLLTDHWPHGGIARAYDVFDDQAGCSLRGSFVVDVAGQVSWSVVNSIAEARDISGHLDALA
jgi:mycoredoxin-dependent peroxiredoxin